MDAENHKGFAGNRDHEYRNCLRYSLSLQARCHYKVGTPVESCRIVNISSEGLGLELDAPVEIQRGHLVVLDIDGATREQSACVVAEIVWVRNPEDGFMTQRMGGSLLYMDQGKKEQLMEHAYAGILSYITRCDMKSPG